MKEEHTSVLLKQLLEKFGSFDTKFDKKFQDLRTNLYKKFDEKLQNVNEKFQDLDTKFDVKLVSPKIDLNNKLDYKFWNLKEDHVQRRGN